MGRKTSNAVVVMGVIGVAVLAVLLYAVFFKTGQTGFNPNGNPASPIITSSTVLSVAGEDSLSPGTALSVAGNYATNGAGFVAFTSGTSTASQGDKIDFLLTNGTYHAVYIKDHVVPAKTTDVIPAKFNGNSTVTINLYDSDSGASKMNDGASNQTATAGGAYNFKARMQGTDSKNTQDMLCLVEVSIGANVSKITMDGKVADTTSKPAWYSLLNSSATIYGFNVAPIVGAETVDHFINVQSVTAKSLSKGEIKVSCSTKEYFYDSQTGKVLYDTTDSLGALKSIATYTAVGYWS